jgi:predicted nucleic acid-binding protein
MVERIFISLLTSKAVIYELHLGKDKITVDRINLLQGLELLEITEEIEEITAIYIEKKVMPNDPVGDALHLALASFHKIDVLLTWNCRHIANPNKFNHIRMINYELGLSTPILTTPMNYLTGGDDD